MLERNTEMFSIRAQDSEESDGGPLESTTFLVGITVTIFVLFVISCLICICVFVIGRQRVQQNSSPSPVSHKKQHPVFVSAISAVSQDAPQQGSYEERVSFGRRTLSKDLSTQVLENLELDEIAIGPCLGRGAYGKVYKGEYAGIPLAIKVCEHDGSFLRSGNEPLETYLSRNIHHDNVVKTLVNETRRCRSLQGSIGELSLLKNPPPKTQGVRDTELEFSSSSKGGSDEFSYIARTMEQSSGEDIYRTWIIMEYCDMGSLDHAIKERKFFATESGNEPKLDFMILTAIDIAGAMRYLHDQRIIHGDLKSQNVLLKESALDERGFYCKVGDFGLSRILANKTHIDTFTCGTVSHSAPELFRHGLLTPAADVYSFGILLWELVSGTKAFSGTPHNSIIMAVTSGRRPQLPAFCPQALSRLINDCWQDSHSDRPSFKTVSRRLRDMMKNKRSFLTSPESTDCSNSTISLSVLTAQSSNNQIELVSNEIPRTLTQQMNESSNEEREKHQSGVVSRRIISTVAHTTDCRSEEEEEESSEE
eukprot:g6877.t1